MIEHVSYIVICLDGHSLIDEVLYKICVSFHGRPVQRIPSALVRKWSIKCKGIKFG